LPILNDDTVILIEQFRIPTQSKVIEIPAGLVGDESEFADESLAETAKRELIEETGYTGTLTHLIGSPTSAGMTPEITHLFAATELEKVGSGGGIDGEYITVHHVPLATINDWLAEKQAEGYHIDFKIHASLWLFEALRSSE